MNTSATETPAVFYSQLAERLVREQLLTSASAREVAQQARSNRITLVQELINGELVDSYHLAALVSEEYGVPLFDLRNMSIEQLPQELSPLTLVQKHSALPLFRRGNRLFIAVADPTNTAALSEFKFATGISTDPIVVEATALKSAIDAYAVRLNEALEGDIADFAYTEDDIPDLEIEDAVEETDLTNPTEDAPVVKFVNQVLYLTSILSPTRESIECAYGQTACYRKLCVRQEHCSPVSPRASKSWRGWIPQSDAHLRMGEFR